MKALVVLLLAVPAYSAPSSSSTVVNLGGELQIEKPKGWSLDDQWFRSIPFAAFTTADAPGVTLRIERYNAENPLHLTAGSFPDALTTKRSDNVVHHEKVIGKRKIPIYEVLTPGETRKPDADAYGDVLGGGKPGVRSKEARCVKAGAYDYVPAYNESLKDKKASSDFHQAFLSGGHMTKVIDACLGSGVLAQMKRGERIAAPPKAPDEAELKRLEEAELAPAVVERWESVAVVEEKDRFYLVRYAGSKRNYFKFMPAFDRLLGSMKSR